MYEIIFKLIMIMWLCRRMSLCLEGDADVFVKNYYTCILLANLLKMYTSIERNKETVKNRYLVNPGKGFIVFHCSPFFQFLMELEFLKI